MALRVLFRSAAGQGQGFGHLVRCRTLAQALGVRPVVSLRGSDRSAAVARRLRCRLWTGSVRALSAARFDLLVVDDPSPRAARPWVAAARRCGVPVASVHDAGRGILDSDLSIDGSFARTASGRRADLVGPAFAILDDSTERRRRPRPGRRARTILVTLGGGRHVRRRGHAVAAAILKRAPGVRVDIAQGFGPRPSRPAPAGARWVRTPRGLAGRLRTATVAVVAGGVTLYEACALGTSIVVLPVVAAQRPAAIACARAGAAMHASESNPTRAVAQAAALAVSLLDDPSRRDDLSRRAGALVDGRGAARVAARLRTLARNARNTGTERNTGTSRNTRTSRNTSEARHAA